MGENTASLSLLRELFPDWSEEDLSICLEESRGDLDTAITRISEGHATKFGEVTKKKEKAPKRVEHGNGRGRGRGASTGVPRGKLEARGRGRGRGVSTSNAPPVGRTAPTETKPQWAENAEPTEEAVQTWVDGADNSNQSTKAPDAAPLGKSDHVTSQSTTAEAQGPAAKAKSRIVDKNSTSSWASIAKVSNPPAAAAAQKSSSTTGQNLKARQPSIHDKPAPLTEENLEAATEDQPNLPEPPAATVASIQGEPATGPSSLAGASVSGGPPGLKTGQQSTSTARVSTPVGGRRLNQHEAVIMPGSERELPGARLGLQFGSLGLGSDEVYSEQPRPAQQKQETTESRPEAVAQAQRSGDGFPSYPGQGAPGQTQTQQAPVGQHGYGGQSQEQYPGMSSFYGQQEQARASSFGNHSDYYQQQAAHGQQAGQQSYGAQSNISHRSEATSRPTEQSSRFGEPTSSPMTSMASQPPQSGPSPVPGHQHQQQSQYPMHPQYGAPNPYAYYGYGYGYPQQQQHTGYGAQMYGQPRGGYGAQGHYAHQPVGTSQDRFERSTAEYQRQQQQQQQPNSHYPQGGYGNTDFLGSSRTQQSSNDAHDPFKGYNNSQGSTGSREDGKANSGFAAQAGYGQQAQGTQYGGNASAQYGGEQQQQQSQYSQYGSYGRQAHQQYGGQWNHY